MKHTNIIKSNSEATRLYERFRGICTDGGIIDPEKKLGYSENMYVDPESSDGALESIPGFRTIYRFSAPIRALHKQKLSSGAEFVLLHVGEKLYRFALDSYHSLSRLDPIADLADRKSYSFSFGRSVYILDGEKIVTIDESGTVSEVSEYDCNGYIPLTYRDGKPVEDRNLLSDKFRETVMVRNVDDHIYGTYGLIYSVTDPITKSCRVSGVTSDVKGEIYIPSYTVIEGVRYNVTAISSGAFWNNDKITAVYVGQGVKTIGSWAFWGMEKLTRVALSPGVESIGDRAFYMNVSLREVYLGIGLVSIGVASFAGCDSLENINYSGGADTFSEIIGTDALGARTINYGVSRSTVSVAIPVFSCAEEILSVEINGTAAEFQFDTNSSEIILHFSSRTEIDGKRVNILGRYAPHDRTGFLASGFGSRLSPIKAVIGSRVCQTFDGRIFLSGNPALAGTVLYSQATEDGTIRPDYFGNSCYFTDGEGDYTVTALHSSEGELAVFKSGDDGSGSIFYHAPKDENGVRTYPVTYAQTGITAKSSPFQFLNDSVFLTDMGLIKLTRRSTGSREAELLSADINPLLLRSSGSISITKWYGYLVLAIGSDVYLGDPNHRYTTGKDGYSWYPIRKVGTHKNATRVYRYADSAPEGFLVSNRVGEVAEGEVMSVSLDGNTVYYLKLASLKIALTQTDEYLGGDFHAQSAMLGDGKLLFFGTECGDLCVFNNDMRGNPPDRLSTAEGFSPEEYQSTMGDKIHPDFYTFAGFTPRYAVLTAEDDCGVPYLEKTTVPSSLVIKTKNMGGSFKCRVKTEQGVRELGKVSVQKASFDEVDMSGLTSITENSSTVPLPDRSNGWIRKQICLISEEFRSPFGVYSISYRYRIKGPVKRKTS